MTYKLDHYREAAAAHSIKMIKAQMAGAELEETSVESGSFHSSLPSEIDSDGDSDMSYSSGGI